MRAALDPRFSRAHREVATAPRDLSPQLQRRAWATGRNQSMTGLLGNNEAPAEQTVADEVHRARPFWTTRWAGAPTQAGLVAPPSPTASTLCEGHLRFEVAGWPAVHGGRIPLRRRSPDETMGSLDEAHPRPLGATSNARGCVLRRGVPQPLALANRHADRRARAWPSRRIARPDVRRSASRWVFEQAGPLLRFGLATINLPGTSTTYASPARGLPSMSRATANASSSPFQARRFHAFATITQCWRWPASSWRQSENEPAAVPPSRSADAVPAGSLRLEHRSFGVPISRFRASASLVQKVGWPFGGPARPAIDAAQTITSSGHRDQFATTFRQAPATRQRHRLVRQHRSRSTGAVGRLYRQTARSSRRRRQRDQLSGTSTHPGGLDRPVSPRNGQNRQPSEAPATHSLN